jgi:phosphatidylserine/phosphatidylglycerophosphate/cardiolipin synthase-like enzyme
VKLIIQPDDGLTPLLKAVRSARKCIDLVVFRFDRFELEKALQAAVARGVTVRALIAHSASGSSKSLRKLELRLLEGGITVTRTSDDLPRYHGKFTVIDDVLYVLGFNYTKQDIEKSRSFGISTREPRLVKEALAVFEADATRQAYSPSSDRLVVSPETSREILTTFVRTARKQLLIYDERVSDKLILRLLRERIAAGVEVRIIGKVEGKLEGASTRKLKDLRLHVRAIVRDGARAFVGSQSLRKLELDARREMGVIVNDTRIARKMMTVFEADWELGEKT